MLLGETVALATGYQFRIRLEECENIAGAAALVLDACLCGLTVAVDLARRRLQALAAVSSDLKAVAAAAYQLSQVVRYGDVRKFDAAPLFPLMEELFVQGTLALHAAAGCDNEAAKELIVPMDELNRVSLEHHDRVEENLSIERFPSSRRRRRPQSAAVRLRLRQTLLERGLLSNESLIREVSHRLSPGVPADLGAGWFEGLAQRDRYAPARAQDRCGRL